jgi:hypothetical protein
LIPRFDRRGLLPPGVHDAGWRQIAAGLGFSARRKKLLKGLRQALVLLKAAGCKTLYLDGSFVTAKREPGDFDACWAVQDVNMDELDPVFTDFSNFRARQKQRFGGEFFPADLPEGATGKAFLEFFQIDKETGQTKGIVKIDLRR